MLSADIRRPLQGWVLARRSVGFALGREPVALFLVAFVVYVAIAVFLVFSQGIIVPDAWSRLANAYYMIFSRDPHLAALGFVWTPLPSLSVLPFLPFKALWPSLVDQAFAGNLMSALYMAGAAVQMRGALLEQGVGRRTTLALTALFALNPIIAYHGANGLSEAPFLFFLIAGVRYLSGWIRSAGLGYLVAGGLALAGAYLTRYEALAAGLASIGLVAMVGWLRASGDRRQRLHAGLADALVFGTPFVLAVSLWAIASWLIVGDPLYAYSAAASYVTFTGSVDLGGLDLGGFVVRQILFLQPFALVIAAAAVLSAVMRRDPRLLASLAIIGSVALFALLSVLRDVVPPMFRYQITWIPLVVLLAGTALVGGAGGLKPIGWQTRQFGARGPAAARHVAGGLTLAVLIGMVAVSVGSSLLALPLQTVAPYESLMLSPVIEGSASQRAIESRDLQLVSAEAAAWIDDLGADDGSIVVEAATGFAIIVQSDNPRQFVITTDRDFRAVLADPVVFGAEYLLVPRYEGLGIDNVRRAYPSLYEDGAGIATLAAEFTDGVIASWRLYKLNEALGDAP